MFKVDSDLYDCGVIIMMVKSDGYPGGGLEVRGSFDRGLRWGGSGCTGVGVYYLIAPVPPIAPIPLIVPVLLIDTAHVNYVDYPDSNHSLSLINPCPLFLQYSPSIHSLPYSPPPPHSHPTSPPLLSALSSTPPITHHPPHPVPKGNSLQFRSLRQF